MALSANSGGKLSWPTLMPMPMMAQAMLPSSPSLLDRLRSLSCTLGRPVVVTSPVGRQEGTAVDLAPDGSLLVRFPDGTRPVSMPRMAQAMLPSSPSETRRVRMPQTFFPSRMTDGGGPGP